MCLHEAGPAPPKLVPSRGSEAGNGGFKADIHASGASEGVMGGHRRAFCGGSLGPKRAQRRTEGIGD